MPVYRLPEEILFPPVELAEPEGLLAVGGDLSVERLAAAYERGIFPWYSQDEPILWWSPDPRMALKPEGLHLPRSLKKSMRKGVYSITFDRAFSQVIDGCAQARTDGTWITREMAAAYLRFHQAGFAHSVEAWRTGEDGVPVLAGGLYGVALGGCFFGESMFSLQPDASKTAFAILVGRLADWGFTLIDCQVATDHLARFGAREIPRTTFLDLLGAALKTEVASAAWGTNPAPTEQVPTSFQIPTDEPP